MERQFAILILALLIDRLIGDPNWLWSRCTHPVIYFGKIIEFFDMMTNKGGRGYRLTTGLLTLVFCLVIAVLCAIIIHEICMQLGVIGFILEAVICSIFIAQKSLYQHVEAVYVALDSCGLPAGRSKVAMIGGRDPQCLDTIGVCRAAIESLAENLSDGIVAPVFWFALLGLPGIIAYKMLNTADSMIGHRNDKYRFFGFAAAKVDDLANCLPARLTALLVIIAALSMGKLVAARRSFWVTLHDASKHRSPNAGWPEAAFAGALNINLSGPRVYNGQLADEPFQNEKGRNPENNEITLALELYGRTLMILLSGLCLGFIVAFVV